MSLFSCGLLDVPQSPSSQPCVNPRITPYTSPRSVEKYQEGFTAEETSEGRQRKASSFLLRVLCLISAVKFFLPFLPVRMLLDGTHIGIRICSQIHGVPAPSHIQVVIAIPAQARILFPAAFRNPPVARVTAVGTGTVILGHSLNVQLRFSGGCLSVLRNRPPG